MPSYSKSFKANIVKKEKGEIQALKDNLRTLEKDLKRKNAALAETTALLVLKKKVDLFFGEAEE